MSHAIPGAVRSIFSQRRPALIAVAALAGLLYANSIGNRFAYDDTDIILDNEAIHSLSTLPAAVARPYWPEFGRELGLWRPLTTAALGLEWALWGERPAGFHVVNMLLHASASVLVLVFLAELLPLAGAVAGAIVFAAHPVHVEAVANIVGIAELLAAIFFLAACTLFLRRRTALTPATIAAITALYAAACFTKESAITLPAVLLLLDAAGGEMDWRQPLPYVKKRLVLFVALAAVAAALLAGRALVLGSIARPFAPLGADVLEGANRFWTVVSVWPQYVRLLFFPADLSADYAPLVIPVVFGPTLEVVLGLFEAAVFLALVYLTWRAEPPAPAVSRPTQLGNGLASPSQRTLAVGVLWFVLTILPVSNVFFLSGVLLAERTLYLPSVGFCLAVGWLGIQVYRSVPALAAGALAAAVVALGFRTITRNPTWYDTASVMETLIAEHPESGRAQWILGTYYMELDRIDEGKAAYGRALNILGYHYPLLIDVGRDLLNAGQDDEAERLLSDAWAQWPELARAPFLLTVLYTRQGRWQEARSAAVAAVAADSTDGVAHHLLATTYAALGSTNRAIDHRRLAIRHGEGEHWQQWYWLAELLLQTGRNDDAAAALDSASVRADTDDARRAIQGLTRQVSAPPAVP
ncbi:MAG: tetratricopeptide repeat protein [Gemmatimonadetes bacterium]|nr:tetratricopeptide repeat protein [Gemmatimonadota bacterium]